MIFLLPFLSWVCQLTLQLLLSYLFSDLFIFSLSSFFPPSLRSCYIYLRLRWNNCLNSSFVSLTKGGNYYLFNVWSVSLISHFPLCIYIVPVLIPFLLLIFRWGHIYTGYLLKNNTRRGKFSTFKIGICCHEKPQWFFLHSTYISS